MSTIDEVERLCKRVRPEDIRHVTPADIDRTLATMTPQQLEIAMKVMLRENKLFVVGAQAKEDVFERVVTHKNGINRMSYLMASRLLLGEPHNQHAVLGKVPESWKDACEQLVKQKIWASK